MGQGYVDVPLPKGAQPTDVAIRIGGDTAAPAGQTASGDVWSSPAAPAASLMTPPNAEPNRPTYLSELWHGINPVQMLDSLNQAFYHPLATVQGLGEAQGKLYSEARDAFEKGDPYTGTRKFLEYLVPLLGPMVDRPGNLAGEGNLPAALGGVTALGLQAVAPELMRQIPSLPVKFPQNVNAAERAAVDFGLREGIPLDMATATGNPVVRGVQTLADNTSLTGSYLGRRAIQRQQQGFVDVGQRLADRTSPTYVNAEQAGQAVRDAVGARATQYGSEADTAYDVLRQYEQRQAAAVRRSGGVQAPATHARPFTDVPFPVDVAPTKAAMRPIYDALRRKQQLVGSLMGDEARALHTLDALMQAPDLAPLSVADSALSDIKALARVDQTFRRTSGQGVAAEAVRNLDRSVVAAARQAGPDVFQALMDGRAATVNKYKAIETFDALGTSMEPVGVYRKLTANKDSSIDLLRKVQRDAPAELPKVGRAFLEGVLQKVQDLGGFQHADKVFADWQNLGTGTKQLLFRDPALVRDLDHFFVLAKKAATNPNPSGTALVGTLSAQGYLLRSGAAGQALTYELGMGALGKLLHSRRATQALIRGTRIPVGARAAATSAAAEIINAARSAGVELVPVAAQTDSTPRDPR